MADEQQDGLSALIEFARRNGASNAQVICTTDICIEEGFANLCREPQCENYGLGAGCPPYVSGPSGFRQMLNNFRKAVVFKLEVPSESLFSSDRQDIFRLLHEIAAGIEQSAVQMGYRNAKAFAGGSCKALFCEGHPKCHVLGEGGECRNPDRARPSMSGFGINVSKLMQVAGWTMNRANPESAAMSQGETSMATVCGLVLVE
jgi:predicted metal-binding protein